MLDDFGTLTVRTTTADSALPVAGAAVRVYGAEEGNSDVVFSRVTDRDGTTEAIRLPAPSRQLSQASNPLEMPYAIYDLEVSRDGYYAKRIFGVSVFSGVNSLQIVNMIPTSDSSIETYPRGNVNANIPENNM